MTSEHRFPLFELFRDLQQAGLPLGLDDYRALVRALQGGFGHDLNALQRLCKALWVTSPDDRCVFEFQFRQFEQRVNTLPEGAPSETETAEPSQQIEATSKDAETPETLSSQELIQREDEVETRQTVLNVTPAQAQDVEMPCPPMHFALRGEYLPITRRQMKQNWRYLRRWTREGAGEELDVAATVDQIGRQGFLLEPVMQPRRVNRVELLLLLDRGGSMVPFHTLADRLQETARRGGRLGRANIYYFHDCPGQWLYHDPPLIEAEPVTDVLQRLHPLDSNVMIVSDAGAARGWFDDRRLRATLAFLTQARSAAARLVWLNPMPPERWPGTTAGEIGRRVPMFDLSRRGFDRAISTLRRQ